MSLQITLVSAQLSHDTELLSNMDPYCFLQIGSQRFRSKTKNEAGKKPVWNERFTFTSTDNILKVVVMDEDTFNDDIVGEGTINVSNMRNRPTQQQQIVQLYYNGKTAGKVILMIGGNGNNQNIWGSTNTNTWSQNTQPNINQPYNQGLNLGYNQIYNQFNQPGYNQQNQWNQPPPQNQWGNMNQGGWPNQPPSFNSPWGDLSQNNGWGSFNPANPNGQNMNSNPNMNNSYNPMQALGGFLNNMPPQNNQGSYPGNINHYNGNPYQ